MDQWLTCNIACWEADHSGSGWYSSLRKGLRDISDYCFRASEDLEENSGEYEGGSAFLSLVGLIARLFDWLLGLVTNEDDLVKERSFGFDRSALRALSQRPAGYDTWDFNGGGGGHHRLNLKAFVRPATVDHTLRYSTFSGGTWSAGGPLPGSTPAAPALASYNGTLYCMVRGADDAGTLYWSSLNGTTWSRFTAVGGAAASPSAPAMAVYQDKLYSVHRAKSGQLFWNHFDGTRWSARSKFPSGTTSSPPALVDYDGKLQCVVRGHTNNNLYIATFNGTQWTNFSPIPGTESASAASLAVTNSGNVLWCIYRAPGSQLHMVYYPWRADSTSPITWSRPTTLPSSPTANAPAIAHHENRLHIAMRLDWTDRRLFHSPNGPHDGASYTAIPGKDSISGTTPALASHNGNLYCVHRG
ncbi:hypothetical protein ACGFX2_32815 [Streptomyces goshikiensis]|uniref:hypothetical protein n=1 Tax=Streptomyces goshikiensis TaxID=1942 RepID=UPI003710CE8E